MNIKKIYENLFSAVLEEVEDKNSDRVNLYGGVFWFARSLICEFLIRGMVSWTLQKNAIPEVLFYFISK